jgi:hypothetical protein
VTNNGKRPRRRYDDKFRASAVVMLEAAGYPERKGALEQTAKHLRTPNTTLHGWYNATRNPPPADVRSVKRGEIADIIRSEIYAALEEAPNARPEASYRDLITGAAILVDKLQLLTGNPTERVELDHTFEKSLKTAGYNDLDPDAP